MIALRQAARAHVDAPDNHTATDPAVSAPAATGSAPPAATDPAPPAATDPAPPAATRPAPPAATDPAPPAATGPAPPADTGPAESSAPEPAASIATTPASPSAAEPAASAVDLHGRGRGRVEGAVVGPAIRTWIGHVVPLTLLSAIALAPLVAIAARVQVPADAAAARSVIQLGWTLLAVAWLGQFMLVGAAAAMIGAPGSQLRTFCGGFVQLVRAVVPCLVAAAAIAIGSLALVVPGVVLLALLALTGASRERGLPGPLLDSLAAARRQPLAVALAVAALFAIDAAIGGVAYRAFLAPLPVKPTPVQLAAVREFVRATALALVVTSPLPATVLATLRARVKL